MAARLHVHITGSVQGVFFRAQTKTLARSLGVTGWVRNTEDGDVEVVAEGEKDELKRLLEWCSRGPKESTVMDYQYDWEEPTGEFEDFSIRY